MEPSGPGVFFVRRLLCTNSISLIEIGLFRLYINVFFSEINSLSFERFVHFVFVEFICIKLFIIIFPYPFNVNISCNDFTSPAQCWSLVFSVSLVFLISVSRDVSVLLVLSKNQFLVSLLFSVVFLFPIPLIRVSAFIISFFSACFGLNLLFVFLVYYV